MSIRASILWGALQAGGLFVLFDALYLGWLRRDHHVSFFRDRINNGESFDRRRFLPLGLLVWFLLGLGTEVFAVRSSNTVASAAARGALLGAIIYGVYDATNLATINAWTPTFAIQDVLWGTVLSATVAGLRKYVQLRQ